MKDKLVAMARKQVGVSSWKYGSKWWGAPQFVDCSSFLQWLYEQIGIHIPRSSYKQIEIISPRISIEKAEAGDVLFVTSPYSKGVGVETHSGLHVCLVTELGTAICATNSELGIGVVEISFEKIFETRQFVKVGLPTI